MKFKYLILFILVPFMFSCEDKSTVSTVREPEIAKPVDAFKNKSIFLWGLEPGITSKGETISIWRGRINKDLGYKAGILGMSGVEIKQSDLLLSDKKTSTTCLGYEAKYNRNNIVQDCFFFQDEKLVALRLILDEKDCVDECVFMRNTLKYFASNGFVNFSQQKNESSILGSYKYGEINLNYMLWGWHGYVSHEKKAWGLRPTEHYSVVRKHLNGCVSIFPRSMEGIIVKHSESNNPNLVCTFKK